MPSNAEVQPIRVLIVDDHGIVREGLRAYLELEPDIHVVGEARDGQEGVRRAQELLPDVVLMDLVMPTMDGVDATSRIKQHRPETHVIILTSFLDDERTDSAPSQDSGRFQQCRCWLHADQLQLAEFLDLHSCRSCAESWSASGGSSVGRCVSSKP